MRMADPLRVGISQLLRQPQNNAHILNKRRFLEFYVYHMVGVYEQHSGS